MRSGWALVLSRPSLVSDASNFCGVTSPRNFFVGRDVDVALDDTGGPASSTLCSERFLADIVRYSADGNDPVEWYERVYLNNVLFNPVYK